MSDIKVSVIVPVYNTEKYIEKCLDYLSNQTLREIEIIVVNDGSTDNSLEILESCQKNDLRIKILSQENKKQGAARNEGIKIAQGEYIGFVDSDDWVDLDYFEKLYLAAKKFNSDIALGTNVRVGNGKTKKRLYIEEEKFVCELQDKFDVAKQAKNPCPTNKIYKTTLLKENEIYFPEGVFCEDKIFTLKTLYFANGLVAVPNVNYYYFRNPNSTVNTKKIQHTKKLLLDKKQANLDVLNFLKEKNVNVRDRQFWAIVRENKFLNITILTVKESLHTRKYFLFGILKLWESKI